MSEDVRGRWKRGAPGGFCIQRQTRPSKSRRGARESREPREELRSGRHRGQAESSQRLGLPLQHRFQSGGRELSGSP